MKILRKVFILLIAAVMAGTIAFTACKKKETDADMGRKAAKEMCNCMSKNTDAAKESCLDALDDKYLKYENSVEFARAAAAELIMCDAFWNWINED